MALIIILTRIYIAGFLLVLLNAGSTVIFSSKLRGKRLNSLALAIIYAPFWPLAVFSDDGRKRLLITVENL